MVSAMSDHRKLPVGGAPAAAEPAPGAAEAAKKEQMSQAAADKTAHTWQEALANSAGEQDVTLTTFHHPDMRPPE